MPHGNVQSTRLGKTNRRCPYCGPVATIRMYTTATHALCWPNPRRKRFRPDQRARSRPARQKQVPADAYYGVQTARALENFQLSGIADQSLSRIRRSLGDRQAGGGPRQHRGRRHEAGTAGR